jgi:sulfate permease, SulP family
VNASPPRTAIVSESGGRSQISGLFAASIVLALLTFGATLLKHVPNAALSGVLLFVALRIVNIRQMFTIYRESIGEFLLILATAAAIIVLPIEQGVAVGITLSLLQGIWTTTRARLVRFERVPATTIWWPANSQMPSEHPPNLLVVGLQAPLSFLNAENFRADVLGLVKSSKPRPQLLVLEASGMVEIDFTAAQIVIDLIRECGKDGLTVAMARLESARARDAFERFKLYDILPKDRIFFSVDEAVRVLAGPPVVGTPD